MVTDSDKYIPFNANGAKSSISRVESEVIVLALTAMAYVFLT